MLFLEELEDRQLILFLYKLLYMAQNIIDTRPTANVFIFYIRISVFGVSIKNLNMQFLVLNLKCIFWESYKG